jgi:alpha-tubulin suppressor-like RCC1 family protein
MKRSLSICVVILVISLLTGCILSKSPKTNSVTSLPGSDMIFNIMVFPSGATYTWTLDNTPLADTTNSYKYTPSHGKHVLTVTAKHSLGTDTWTWNILDAEAAVPINSSGGTVAVTSSSSPLAGTKVTIPVNALIINVTITISGADAPSGLPGQSAGPCIDFGPEGTQFNVPVELSLPYPDADNDGIVDGTGVSEDQVKAYWYNEGTSAWEEVPIMGRDTAANLVRINATHFSEYTTGVKLSIWMKTIGGSGEDSALAAHQTSDGGYIFTGGTGSYGSGGSDTWLIKTDPAGNEVWRKLFGGSKEDYGYAMQPTTDNGYIIDAMSSSFGTGNQDIWLIKTDASGNEQWNRTFGLNATAYSIQQTSDGGYILTGYTGDYILLLKTDVNGNQEWLKTFGDNPGFWQSGMSVQQANDGGYVLVGQSNSGFLMIKTDSSGEQLWKKYFTGMFLIDLQKTNDDEYIMTGQGYNRFTDRWDEVVLVKADSEGNEQWKRTYGVPGSDLDVPLYVKQTIDGGYVIACDFLSSGYDALIIKTDSQGKVEFDKMFGGPGDDMVRSIEQTSDGGYIISGATSSYGAGQIDAWLVKIDAQGNIPINSWSDSDGDGLLDVDELIMGTNPLDADTDDDGLIDGQEDSNHNGVVDVWETSPLIIDTDGDGLQDGTELGVTLAMVGPDTDLSKFKPDLDPTTTTNPLSIDTDHDGIPDGVEDANHNGRVDPGELDPNVPNNPPVAEAGSDQSVFVNTVVTLDGSSSTDPDNNIASYHWQQIGGPSVILKNENASIAQFMSTVRARSTLTFKITVIDSDGLTSNDTCIIKTSAGSRMAVGYYHTLFINSDGSLWAWGKNGYGQLGDGTTIDKASPAQIGYDLNWSSVSSGSYHSVAIKTDGSLWAWGYNNYGQLGDATTNSRIIPKRIGTDNDWMTVAAGDNHTVAIKTDGSLWAWGYNNYGQLGDGTTTNKNTPTRIGTGTNWVSVATGGFPLSIEGISNLFSNTMAIKADGSLWAWGSNLFGYLGVGQFYPQPTNTPRRIGTSSDWISVAPGYLHTMALKANRSLWGWGQNSGQLGDGTTTSYYVPTQIGTSTDWASVDTGLGHTIAMKTDCSLWAWGDNTYGQLGDGTTTSYYVPVRIRNDTNWAAITAGEFHNLAIKADSSLWAWGQNTYNQLGDRTKTDKYIPTQIGTDQWIDSDHDGLFDVDEVILGTNPLDADTDDDGIIDGHEDSNHNGIVDLWETGPLKIDTDGDGIQDGIELGVTLDMIGPDTDLNIFQPDLDPATTTDPVSIDTDHDGIPDGVEDANHNGRVDPGELDPNVQNRPPVADAGPDKGFSTGANVTLNGTGSTDPENNIVSYHWQQTGGPSVTLINADTAIAQFTASVDNGSTLTFELTVTDSGGLQATDTCVVTIQENGPPVANAGPDRMVLSGVNVTLNGSGSTDPDNNIASYHWQQTGGPSVTLTKADTAIAEFTASVDDGSILTFELTVTDAYGLQATDTCVVTIQPNRPPVANAGPDRMVLSGVNVTLNGSGSTDPDNNIASYHWQQTAGPSVTINNADMSIAHFRASVDTGSTLTFEVTVTDTRGLKSTDTCTISTHHPNTIAAGGEHTVAIKTDGSLWAWGDNYNGQLGDGTTIDKLVPTRVGIDTDWISVYAGMGTSFAIKADGSLWGWGENGSDNQLGIGDWTISYINHPTRIGTDNDWINVSSGESHHMAIKADGSLWAWGVEHNGEFGNGKKSWNFGVPTQIGTDTDWVKVSAGGGHTLAIKADGSLWAWGENTFGQVGDGTTIGKFVPTRIGTDTDWVIIGSGRYHSMAMKTDGSLWGWGHDGSGELGDGDFHEKHIPTRIGIDTDWVSMNAGGDNSFAIKADGSLWGWGYNDHGEVGDGTEDQNRHIPTRIGTDIDWVTTFTTSHTVAIGADGSLWTWGWNYSGEIGDGTTTNKLFPTRIGTDTDW